MAIEYLGLSQIGRPVWSSWTGVQRRRSMMRSWKSTVAGRETAAAAALLRFMKTRQSSRYLRVRTNMSLKNTAGTRLTGHPMETALSQEILGRTFNGIGRPIDDAWAAVRAETKRDINGLPLNPVAREYPRNYIRTGISAIDGLTTLIRGQKLPIFSGNGHACTTDWLRRLSARRLLGDDSDEQFAIVFAAMGVKYDVADYFRRTFEESGVSDARSHVPQPGKRSGGRASDHAEDGADSGGVSGI